MKASYIAIRPDIVLTLSAEEADILRQLHGHLEFDAIRHAAEAADGSYHVFRDTSTAVWNALSEILP